MRNIFITIAILITLITDGQNFHCKFDDDYFMQPVDFIQVENGYILAINHSNEYANTYQGTQLIKTDIEGNRIETYSFSRDSLLLQGIRQLNDTINLVYGYSSANAGNHVLVYVAQIDNKLKLIKEFEFKADQMIFGTAGQYHIRANLTDNNHIICCISGVFNGEYSNQKGYLLALNNNLELLNANYFIMNLNTLAWVDDIIPFYNSDTSLVIISNRKAYLVDAYANILDSVDNFLLYEDGYHMGRTFSGVSIDNKIFISGKGYYNVGIAVFDRKMNRLKTEYYGDLTGWGHMGYTNTFSYYHSHFYSVMVNDWDAYDIYLAPENYMIVRKIDTALNLIWEKNYQAEGWSFFPFSIKATSDGGFGLVATRNHYETMGDRVEAYFLKADSLGNFDSTLVDIKEVSTGIVDNIELYPNPGVNQITIEMPQNQNPVTLQLFDINGNCILHRKIYQSQQIINTQILQPGMYFYSISSKHKIIAKGKWLKVE